MNKAHKILLILAFISVSAFMPNEDKITIYLVGDSTMCTQPVTQAPVTGWGTPFATFFNNTVTVDNRAKGGRSTRTFISENKWQPVVDALKDGDYVFIQFGHNDEAKEEQYKDRYTSPAEYKKNLVRFITESTTKGAIPVLITPVSRRRFSKEGAVLQTHIDYSKIVAEVAVEQRVPMIDLDSRSRELYQSFGAENSKLLFNDSEAGANPQFPGGIHDGTHFSEYGARRIAELVLSEMRKLNLGLVSRVVNFKKA